MERWPNKVRSFQGQDRYPVLTASRNLSIEPWTLLLLESPCADVDTKKPIEVATEFENSANRTVGRNGLLAGENLYPVENFGPFTLPVYQRCQIFSLSRSTRTLSCSTTERRLARRVRDDRCDSRFRQVSSSRLLRDSFL